jgi:hypothetical protein
MEYATGGDRSAGTKKEAQPRRKNHGNKAYFWYGGRASLCRPSVQNEEKRSGPATFSRGLVLVGENLFNIHLEMPGNAECKV